MNHLCQTIHHHQDGVIGIRRWKIYDEIHKKLKIARMHGSTMVEGN
jgi:hypothetical protein